MVAQYGKTSMVSGRWDWTKFNKALHRMDKYSATIMGDAIARVLKDSMVKTQNKMVGTAPIRQRQMNIDVADSLIVEQGEIDKQAAVRVGADPIDAGGPTASRGGKIAAMLEEGVSQMPYPFKFKKVQNTDWFGKGQKSGFIDAKQHAMHPGFKPAISGKGWLTHLYEDGVPKIAEALIDAIENMWGAEF